MNEPGLLDLVTPAGRLVHATDLDRAIDVLRTTETLSVYLTVTFARCWITHTFDGSPPREERRVRVHPWGDQARPAGLLVADAASHGGLGAALTKLCDGIEFDFRRYDGPEDPIAVDLHYPGVPSASDLTPRERQFVFDLLRGLEPTFDQEDRALAARIVAKLRIGGASDEEDEF